MPDEIRPRKAHKKSRGGCAECKRRHIKCSEERPQCATCKHRKMQCVWLTAPTFGGPQLSNVTPTPSPPNQWGTSIDETISSFDNVVSNGGKPNTEVRKLNITELKLMHHFTSSTYATLDQVESQQYIWQKDVVKLGLDHNFVLRGLFAVCALHLASLEPEARSEYITEASTQYNKALEEFRTVLRNPSDENATAAFIFSTLTVIHASAIAELQASGDPIRDFLHCLHLVRGVSTVLRPHFGSILSGPFGPLLHNGLRKGAVGEVPEILKLKALVITSHGDDEGTKSACLEAIDQLHTTFLELQTMTVKTSSLVILLTWPAAMGPVFFTLLTVNHPIALVILGHFAALFYSERNTWWLSQSYERIINSVEAIIPPQYLEWLLWPKQLCGLA